MLHSFIFYRPQDLGEGPARKGWADGLVGGWLGGWLINLPGVEKGNSFHCPTLIEMSPGNFLPPLPSA